MTTQLRYACSGFYPKRHGIWIKAEFPTFDGCGRYTPPYRLRALTLSQLVAKAFDLYAANGLHSVSLSENYGSWANGGQVVSKRKWLTGPCWHPDPTDRCEDCNLTTPPRRVVPSAPDHDGKGWDE